MKKSIEMKKELEEMRNEIKALKDEGKIEDAHTKLTAFKELENKIKEVETEEALEAMGNKKVEITNDMNVNVLFNRVLKGKSITDEERQFLNAVGTPGQVEATDGKGGYLVPIEQFEKIKELKRERVELKALCNVVSVKSLSGNMPIEKGGDGELISFEELNTLNKSDIDFGQVSYKTKDYGDIIPVSNSLLADETANLTAHIGKRFAKKAVNTENKKILDILKTLTPKTIADYTGINTALNVDLDPAISANAIILTNQSGFNFLDNLTDKQNRPLLEVNLQNTTQKMFKGRKIIVLKDTVLPMNTTKAPVFVGDMSEFITFFDREGLELALSTEAGFNMNATFIRAIERFDVAKVDGEAMVYLELATK
ncbi:Predicted phage phi-C31 gp36 major capsid-like protein [Fusobacterium polymorphum]|uniref:Bacteriophage capsid protein n=1 Tax=Fusobacterium polymorphum ATCC 10953 TaxID=393480 RepID=A5TX36_FUSNP|nr:phage major capsid protein [Fusobacterium polymorphum]EDK89461.1 bacteriophage capsid protein [Fusobacterium polymorphum ATCC 10953]UTI52609.1 phage major capsid protein [Fusobacterium polymorphum]WRL69350.1 phage major capsid protein [Fusobacterium polymorphum]CKH08753.1 Predicted phage phi-C31 gp36 major capsid-like protein [Fusobacterium polymorphum]